MFKSFGRSIKKVSKMRGVLRNAIGNIALEMSPNKLVGVKLRRIPGETVCVNAPLGLNESLDRARLMDGTGIPEQDKALFEVSEEGAARKPRLRDSEYSWTCESEYTD